MKIRYIVVATLITLTAVVVMPLGASADTASPNKAVISFVPSNEPAGQCLDVDHGGFNLLNATGALAPYKTVNTSETFVLQFELKQRLCNPIIAKGVVYDMPGPYANAWPQELVSVTEFAIQEKGTYTISFDKTCQAQQFDVLVGATPQTVTPTNPSTWHGPLLFALDSSTALQWWGFECVDDTVVTTEPTTTSTTTTTTTTIPEDTTTTTTTLPEDTTTTTTTDPEVTTTVLGTQVTRPGDPGDPGDPADPNVQVGGVSVQQLPVTGGETRLMLGGAVLLIGAGSILAVSFRRRRSLLG